MRGIDHPVDRARLRFTLTYSPHPRFRFGIEANPQADELGPLANVVAVTETERRPALVFGLSSDRIGTPDGRAVFATLSKDLQGLTGLPIAPWLGVSHGGFDDELRAIGGVRARFGERWAGVLLHDGVNLHPMLELHAGPHSFTLLWVELEHPGVAYSVAF